MFQNLNNAFRHSTISRNMYIYYFVVLNNLHGIIIDETVSLYNIVQMRRTQKASDFGWLRCWKQPKLKCGRNSIKVSEQSHPSAAISMISKMEKFQRSAQSTFITNIIHFWHSARKVPRRKLAIYSEPINQFSRCGEIFSTKRARPTLFPISSQQTHELFSFG